MNGDVHLAYRVVGGGPNFEMLVSPWLSNIDVLTTYQPIQRAIDRFGTYSKIIMWDRRGTGLSDRLCGTATLEQGVDDLLAVLDAVGAERASLFGVNEGGTLCAMAAATHPERFSHLVLYGSYATTVRKDDYPWAPEF